MQQRTPQAEVIRGLSTTSAKIRALAEAGYDRTEISKILDIRYQHVRNVLVSSRITGGLRRVAVAEREPVIVDSEPAPRKDISWQVLRDAGFQLVGEWRLQTKGGIKLDGKAPAEPGVYAFVLDDIVAYVGLTNNGLRTRFDQYRRGHERQRTSARINKLIGAALSSGKTVKVVIAIPEPSEWHDLPVNTAAGLEGGLIAMIRPAWNIQGAG